MGTAEAETKKEVRQTAANKEEKAAAAEEGRGGVGSSWRHRKSMKGEVSARPDLR